MSAIDLLDEAFETSSNAESQKSSNPYHRTNSMNFDEFDFWTSTIDQNKQNGQNGHNKQNG